MQTLTGKALARPRHSSKRYKYRAPSNIFFFLLKDKRATWQSDEDVFECCVLEKVGGGKKSGWNCPLQPLRPISEIDLLLLFFGPWDPGHPQKIHTPRCPFSRFCDSPLSRYLMDRQIPSDGLSKHHDPPHRKIYNTQHERPLLSEPCFSNQTASGPSAPRTCLSNCLRELLSPTPAQFGGLGICPPIGI